MADWGLNDPDLEQGQGQGQGQTWGLEDPDVDDPGAGGVTPNAVSVPQAAPEEPQMTTPQVSAPATEAETQPNVSLLDRMPDPAGFVMDSAQSLGEAAYNAVNRNILGFRAAPSVAVSEELPRFADYERDRAAREAAGELPLWERILTWQLNREAPEELEAQAAEAAQRADELYARRAEFPMSERGGAAIENIGNADGFREGFSAALDDPLGTAAGVGEVFMEQGPTLAAAAMTRNPALGASVFGGSSYLQERYGQLVYEAQDAGYDLSDPEQALAAVNDQEFMDRQAQRGRTRGSIIAAVDLLTAGLASRAPTTFRGLAGQTGVQTAGGAGGEAAAEYADTGTVNPGEVIVEGLAEGVGAPVDVAAMTTNRLNNTPGRVLGRELSNAVNGSEFTTPAEDVAPTLLSTPQDRPVSQEAPAQPQPPEMPQAPEAPQAPGPAPGAQVAPRAPEPPEEDEAVTAPAQQSQPAPPETGEAPAQPQAPTEPQAPQAPEAQEPPANPERRSTVYTPDNQPVEVETVVVEAEELTTSDQEDYPQELQPRDRDRAASETQIESIANAPNPARLDANAPETDRGAPIIGPDGRIVESGNGRVMGLRRAYERGTAETYRQYIAKRYPEAAQMRNPVLVRRRVSEVDEQDFTVASNRNAGMELSASENAQADARKIDDEVLGNYRGGGIGSAGNRDMVRSFISKLPASQQNTLVTAEGGLSVEGQRRFQNALFAKAYNDDRLLARVAENPDNDMRSVTNALTRAAPRIAQLKNAIERGEVSPDTDISNDLRIAMEQLSDMRARGMNLRDFRAQQDAFAEPNSQATEDILDAFFNEAGTRLASQDQMGKFLDDYAAMAQEQKIDQGDLPGVEPTPTKSGEEIVRAVKPQPEQTQTLLDRTGGEPTRGRQADAQRERASDGQSDDLSRDQNQRTADGEGRAENTETRRVEDNETLGKPPKGSLSPSFLSFSFNNRRSVFKSAFQDAGLDPDKASLMDTDRQLKVLKPMIEDKFGIKIEMPKVAVQKKNVVGRKTTQTRTGISSREAVDQLLDAYQNMQMMASVLNLPSKAIGLQVDGQPITLSLVGRKQLGALGMYSFTGDGRKRTIYLPGRSNSFAHEWAHALDHYLTMNVDPKNIQGLLSEKMSADGIPQSKSPNAALTDAFAHVLWSMFGENTQLGALHIKLEVDSAQLNANGQPTPKAKRAKKVLDDIKAGKRPPKEYLSRYFKNAAEYDAAISGGGYFTNPAEMFARAVETYIGRTVAAETDLPQSFMTKGGWAYSESVSEKRAALTFPKDVDAYQFGVALQGLTNTMMQMQLFGQEPTATRPMTDGVLSDRAMLKLVEDNRSLWKREMDELSDSGRRVKSLLYGTTGKTIVNGVREGSKTFYDGVIESTAAAMWGIAGRQKNPEAKKALENIAGKVAKMPGLGKETGKLWQQEFETKSRRRTNRINNAIKQAYNKGKVPEADKPALKALLNGRDAPAGTSQKVIRLASQLREMMDELYYDMRDAGVDLNYEQGYLPHIYDVAAVDKSPEAQARFRTQAAKVYELMFERDIMDSDDFDAKVKDINTVVNKLRKKKRATAEGGVRRQNYMTDEAEATLAAFRKAKSKQRDMERRLEQSDDPDDADALGRIEEQAAKVQELMDELLDQLRPIFGEASAEEWYSKQHSGALTDTPSFGPSSSILESRKLPKEASQFMEEFMVSDPVELVMGHVWESTRLAEFAKLFGPKGEELDLLLTAAGNAGASQYDLNVMKDSVNSITGRIGPANKYVQVANNLAFVLGTLKLLSATVFSSLAEPVYVGFRTGRAGYGVSALARNLTGVVRRGNQRQLKELSQTVGLITDAQHETIASNRLGSDATNMSLGAQKTLAGFFQVTLATPLYNYQRRTMLPLAHQFVRELLREAVAGQKPLNSRLRDYLVTGEDGAFANGELNELGIFEEEREALLDWVEGLDGLPTENDLFAPDGSFNPAAELWVRATTRFIDETIQNPQKANRPIAANNPSFTGMYAIMSFIMEFHRNILRRTVLRGAAEDDSMGRRIKKVGWNLALAAPAVSIAGTAYIAQEILRTALTDPGKFDEWEEEEDETVEEQILWRAFSRSGVTGRWDSLHQVFTGVKYETDVTSLLVGAYKSDISGNFQDIASAYVGRNSENTNTAEHKAAEAFYNLLVKPALLAGISWGPMGPVTGKGSALAAQGAGRWDTATTFADALVGEKGTKHRGDPPWWEVGD